MAYEPLPTKEQIQALTVVEDLEAIRDEIDRRTAKIETDLDFLDADEDWERRARNALAFHRYTANIVGRRIQALTKYDRSPMSALKAVATSTRERTDCDPLSWELLTGDPLDISGIVTPEAIDAALEQLNRQMLALERDRADEVASFAPHARDEGWLIEASAALKAAKAVRHQLNQRQAGFRQAEKTAKQVARDTERGQRFIEEARALLPQETFLLIWDRVDRHQLAAA